MLTLSCIALALALIPAVLTILNLPYFCVFKSRMRDQDHCCKLPSGESQSVSVLIPARDEASSIGNCIEHALASEGVNVEVIVLDDHSTDGTAERVLEWSSNNPNVKLRVSPPLPSEWNGKQHACHQLAQHASHEHLLFIDADVRLEPKAIRDLVTYQTANEVDLLSAFPKQQMETWLETWLIPMMHVILLGYLPFQRMRTSSDAAYAAGCGQIFLTTKRSYKISDGHRAIRESRHDGLRLPRSYRENGLRTDVIDGTNMATCRMYHRTGQVIRGVLKNAHEGIAKPKLIIPFTVFLLGGTVLPSLTASIGVYQQKRWVILVSILALIASHASRFQLAIRFRHSKSAVIFHVPAVALFIFLQWIGMILNQLGYTLAWRGRS